MNILPKKSWHVRTKKNIERVRRDEAEAAAKEKELSKRAHIANFEASLDVLRKRNGAPPEDNKPNGVEASEKAHDSEHAAEKKPADLVNPAGSSGAGHLNLFRDVELAEGKLHGANVEAEADRKREIEEWEKKVGILQYLGQSGNADGGERFYQRLERTADGPAADESLAASARRRDEREKDAQDPLRTIHKYLWSHKAGGSSSPTVASSSSIASTSLVGSSSGGTGGADPRSSHKPGDLRRIEFLPEARSSARPKLLSGERRRRPSISSSSTDDEYSRRQRKRKKAKKSKRRRTPSSESDPESEEERRDRKRANFDLLRRQRLDREEREHRRTREYLASLVGKVREEDADAKAVEEASAEADRSRRYNSQYNPHLARY